MPLARSTAPKVAEPGGAGLGRGAAVDCRTASRGCVDRRAPGRGNRGREGIGSGRFGGLPGWEGPRMCHFVWANLFSLGSDYMG